MVNPDFVGGLAARAMLFAGARLDARKESKEVYAQRTNDATVTLQKWYNTGTGLWSTTGWWNSGNVLTMLGDFAVVDRGRADALKLRDVFETTFVQAQKSTQSAIKTISEVTGLVESHYVSIALADDAGAGGPISRRGFSGFINEYYDDEGWWALAWIRAFDVYGTRKYLDMAEAIFRDMETGEDDKCGGGIWWNKERKYKNAIANELYLSVAASLANRDVKARPQQAYRDVAARQWAWLRGSGMLNKDNLFNDGLTIGSDGKCTNNGDVTWTYNQGVILGGLVEMARFAPARPEAVQAVPLSKRQQPQDGASLIATAETIAAAAIKKLAPGGILVEPCEPNCGGDGPQFKGIFVRNLRSLAEAQPDNSPDKSEFRDFIFRNADSIWEKDRDSEGRLGLSWAGPPDKGKTPGADTHSAAMDALVAAAAVS